MWLSLVLACGSTAPSGGGSPVATADTAPVVSCDPDPASAAPLAGAVLPADGVVRTVALTDGFTRLALDPRGADRVEVMASGTNPVTAVFTTAYPEEWLGCVANAEHCGETVQLRSIAVEGELELELGPWDETVWVVAWPSDQAPRPCEEEP